MATRNVNLTDHYDQFVESLLVSGRYQNASEVMRAGLRLLEREAKEDEGKLAARRGLAAEGFDALDRGEGRRSKVSGKSRTSSRESVNERPGGPPAVRAADDGCARTASHPRPSKTSRRSSPGRTRSSVRRLGFVTRRC